MISNPKTTLSTNNYLGSAAVIDGQKPPFLPAMAEWVKTWQTERIFNCEKFTLTAQTSPALVRTLLCLSLLIEDLLGEGHGFVLTSRFQSNPLERRFGKYWQMSDGKILVRLRDVTSYEKIFKIKSLLKVHW